MDRAHRTMASRGLQPARTLRTRPSREVHPVRVLPAKTLPKVLALLCGVAWMVGLSGCRQAQPTPVRERVPVPEQPAPVAPTPVQASVPEPQPAAVERIPLQVADSSSWLFAQTPRAGAPGGWITGSFDPAKNRIEIQLQDLKRFTLHVARIPINWDRLVILRLNGHNTELRRREQSLYHFELTPNGGWQVREE